MSQTLSVTEVARHFAEYINRVVYRGECFVLMRGNKPVAELRPLPVGKRLAELPALLASLPHLAEMEATQFADALSAAREVLAHATLFVSMKPSNPST
jgi:antitoxin (DNA-binding transcriptional repressor) of toxin-antitoxin stability system